MKSIAHIRESDGKVQTVEEHLLEVKELAEGYGDKLDLKHLCGLAGLLHDLGKYKNEFTTYILAATSNVGTAKPKRGEVDHSTAGGKLLYERFRTPKNAGYKGLVAEIVGNAIISHHSYLKDFLNPDLESPFLSRVKYKVKGLETFELTKQIFFDKVMGEQAFNEYVDKAAKELEHIISRNSTTSPEIKCMFLTKFVFSALIDADRTNTRIFEENKQVEQPIDVDSLFDNYYEKLILHIESLKKNTNANSNVNLLRSQMSEQCDRFANNPSGIYTLSIPTGGGKTLASLRYALKHALTFHKKRIVYVVPYTTIIEQNAEEVRRILKDDKHILEHHSNVIESETEDDEDQDGYAVTTQQKLKLARDNWDSPIIFTTMVQFLNVFYAKGSRNIRRLHNLCESVIIFDEVQKVPTACVSLFNHALNFLKDYGQSSMVLCTATQPTLDLVEQKLNINKDAEIIDEIDDVVEAFKRIELIDRATDETFNNEKLAEFVHSSLQETKSILVILNTKSVVKKLYEQLHRQVMDEKGDIIPVYYLSTSMCASHRKDILDKVRGHLSNDEKIICISTQLIEAGVDVSFECVIRSLAGLDSIAQAAGRCNRHGKDSIRQVYMIDHADENLDRLKEIAKGKAITQKMLRDLKFDPSDHGGHLLSRQAMENYFQEFYMDLKTELNYSISKIRKDMTNLLFSRKNNPDSYSRAYYDAKKEWLPLNISNSYGTAADHFQVIDNLTTSVIVPYGDGKEIIADLNGAGSIDDFSRLMKKAQQYTVNLYEHEVRKLDQNSGIESCLDGKVYVLKETAYSEDFGCDIENDSQMGMLGL
ncbi:CRISPR-associated helicase Cas3' [Paenibacillus sp. N1-5-1-14]|uniref:CRISPR-associated helicase Cas3' n=1 Tax=Paenibacillus radicibacter TaxID=2972488 RepID=UPI0021591FE1|nr:CRISPR-associated helicase Cas3' [Paenibacillus radicibacter]MCR8644608.1 CRISPR-associated helicase Cas3' [Paenibacillus radicibacter]